MKKLLVIFLAFGSALMHAVPNFEFWNKGPLGAVWVAVANERTEKAARTAVLSSPLMPVEAGEKIDKIFNLNNYTKMVITRDPNATEVMLYSFPRNKTLYVRRKVEDGKVIFGPQTGPAFGIFGKTESGYPLKNNVKKGEITEEQAARSLGQKFRRGWKEFTEAWG